jgi:hypothetical protein
MKIQCNVDTLISKYILLCNKGLLAWCARKSSLWNFLKLYLKSIAALNPQLFMAIVIVLFYNWIRARLRIATRLERSFPIEISPAGSPPTKPEVNISSLRNLCPSQETPGEDRLGSHRESDHEHQVEGYPDSLLPEYYRCDHLAIWGWPIHRILQR